MANVLIVYATDYGSTEKAAKAVASGVSGVDGVDAVVKKAEEVTADDIVSSDALVLGSPVHMGSPDWRIKKFMDTVCSGIWGEDQAVGKVGAVFTTGSGYGNTGGGAELCQLVLLSCLAEMGTVIVSLPKTAPGYANGGLHWGPHARAHNEDLSPGALTDERLEAMSSHGTHIANLTKKLAGSSPFTG